MQPAEQIKPDLEYGQNGFAAFPPLPGQSRPYPGACHALENGGIVVALLDLAADRRGVFIRLDEQGHLDETFGENGFKRVAHGGSSLFGYLEFRDLLHIPAEHGGGYVAISHPELPVHKDDVSNRQAIHIAFTRFTDSLDIQSAFGDAGVSMPTYNADDYGGWEETGAAERQLHQSVNEEQSSRSTNRGFSVKERKLRVIHSAHVRNSGFNFFRLLLLEVDLDTGHVSSVALQETDLGNPSGEYQSCVFLNDGRVVVAGRHGLRGDGAPLVAAYMPNGELDLGFGPTPDQKAGYVAYVSGLGNVWYEPNKRLLVKADRLRGMLFNGEHDNTFNGDGFASAGFFVQGLLDSGNGFINGENDSGLLLQRWTESGLDMAFGSQGFYLNSEFNASGWGAFVEGFGLLYSTQYMAVPSLPVGILKLLWQPV